MQSPASLNVLPKACRECEPHRDTSPVLQVQARPARVRVRQGDLLLAGVPPVNVQQLGTRGGLYPVDLVPVAVEHQHRVAVGRLDHFLQGAYLLVREHVHHPFLVIDRPARELVQLSPEHRGVGRRDRLAVCNRQQRIAPELLVDPELAGQHLNDRVAVDPLRHVQVILSTHGHRDVLDPCVDLLLGVGSWFEVPAHVVPHKERVGVARVGPAQPLAPISQVALAPEPQQALRGRCGTQEYHPVEFNAPKRLETRRGRALEPLTLVNHQHVERPAVLELINQPLHVIAPDHLNRTRCPKRTSPLRLVALDHQHRHLGCPQITLGLPHVLRNALRSHDQHLEVLTHCLHHPKRLQGRCGLA